MRRISKKEQNLNKLKTGCSPCINQAKIMEQKISKRDISKIKVEEIKNIVASIFKEN